MPGCNVAGGKRSTKVSMPPTRARHRARQFCGARSCALGRERRSAITPAPKLMGSLVGAHSPLEWRYVRDVEIGHGLPRAARQARSQAGHRTRYLDNNYVEFGLVVELDGRAAHPIEERWQDIHRDNISAATGMVTLRYNWADITTDPCRVASEIAAVLSLRGWTGRLRPCGPACTAVLP